MSTAPLVTPPATIAPSGTGYTPYRSEAEPVIGLAVPLSSDHAQTAESFGPRLPVSAQTYEDIAFEKARQVSGVHELS